MLTRFHRLERRKTYRWLAPASLCLMLALQACGGNNSNFTPNGPLQVNVAAPFAGSLLFVKGGNLFILRGKDHHLTQLTQNGSAFQPSVSHNGATIAFEVRQPGNDYSDLATMPNTPGGAVALHTDNRLLCRCDPDQSGVYHYQFWASNPIWTADDQNLIYLSDYFKGGRATPRVNQTCTNKALQDSIQDLGIVETPANAQPLPALPRPPAQPNPPKLLAWPYCYAGGDQDLSLRPGVADTEILFTSFRYVGDKEDLVAQLSLLILTNDGSPYRVIQLSPTDPKLIPLEPSWSPDGKYITYIRRENGQDNLYAMAVDPSITGTPTTANGGPETYQLVGNGKTAYYSNFSYYGASQKLADGIIGQPVWGSNNALFLLEFTNNEFDLFLAQVKVSAPAASATATPGASATSGSAPTITLDGAPTQLTQDGIDGGSRPVWLNA